jgi:glycosyltransferase involved in cell wall biosynthesis
MKLSVLIPIYQHDVCVLVEELYRQLKETGVTFEISCLDDYSDEKFRFSNRNLLQAGKSEIRYSELAANTGRSAIRNQLAEQSKGEFLWFLDCDADARVNPNLARNFVDRMKQGCLFSGGRVYQEAPPADPAFYLHWLWGSRRELLDPAQRMRDPVNHFLSNNFVMHRNDFNRVKFNIRLKGYGYEDTFFAYELHRAGIRIEHIRNPLMHIGLERNDHFLEKIRESLHNLHRLEQICQSESIDFPVKSRLIQTYQLLNNPVFRPISKMLAGLFLPLLNRHLIGKNPQLPALDAYRLFSLIRTAGQTL